MVKIKIKMREDELSFKRQVMMRSTTMVMMFIYVFAIECAV